MQFEIVHITSLFENATEGFIVTDSNGNIILVNPSACRMFGYEPDELIGQKIEILIPSEYRKKHIKLRDAFYNEPKNRVKVGGKE
jgi:PAS domain S-box-containing protein